MAELTTFVPGRRLDDNATILLRYANGAKGTVWASQVTPGNENALKVRIYGTKGGIEWAQEDPNYLYVTKHGAPRMRYTRGGDGAWPEAARVTRVPSGHPEGYLEGFANLYQEAARAIRAAKAGRPVDAAVIYPTVEDGLSGVRFIERAVESSQKGNIWVNF
jgi:predicted dehydrogenase